MSNIHMKYGITDFVYPNEEAIKNPNDVRHISIQNNSISVVKSEKTEMNLSLDGFYTLIDGSEKNQIILNPYIGNDKTPYIVDRISLPNNTTFLAMLCEYKDVYDDNSIDWCFTNLIDSDNYVHDNIQNIDINYSINVIKGGYKKSLHYDDEIGHLWIGTTAGILQWDGKKMKLQNKFNSKINLLNVIDIDIDTNDNVWMITDDIDNENVITYYNTPLDTVRQFVINRSDIIDSQIKKIKIFSTSILVAITSKDLIILNYKDDKYEVKNKKSGYNFDFTSLIDICNFNNIIYFCDQKILYFYNMSTNSIDSIDLQLPTSENIQCLKVINDKAYIGTNENFIIYNIINNTINLYNTLNSIIYENEVMQIEHIFKNNINKLYLLQKNHVSVYNILNNEFEMVSNEINILENPIYHICPLIDSYEYIYFYGDYNYGDTADKSGLLKIKMINDSIIESVPESNKSNELIFIYPNLYNTLYSIDQPIYLLFSKLTFKDDIRSNIDILFKNNYIKDKNIDIYDYIHNCNIEILDYNINGNYFYMYKLTFDKSFLPSSEYDMTISNSIRSVDNSNLYDSYNLKFYTQNVSPIDGWNTIEKLMVLNSNEKNYLKDIYIRNKSNKEVTINFLFGKK